MAMRDFRVACKNDVPDLSGSEGATAIDGCRLSDEKEDASVVAWELPVFLNRVLA